jgi:hypothetical protein
VCLLSSVFRHLSIPKFQQGTPRRYQKGRLERYPPSPPPSRCRQRVVSINGCATDGGGGLSPPSATRSGGSPSSSCGGIYGRSYAVALDRTARPAEMDPSRKQQFPHFFYKIDSTSEMTGDGWSRCGKTFDFVVRLDTCQCHVVTFVT